MEGLDALIAEGNRKIEEIGKDVELLERDGYVQKILKAMYDVYYSQIYDEYIKSEETENELREILRFVLRKVLPILERKMKMLSVEINKRKNRETAAQYRARKNELTALWKEYAKIYDDYYALVCLRSLEHFAQYMEWDLPEGDKVWKNNINCFRGLWHYANKMILDHDWKIIEKQCPTGYGKSYSDIVMIGYIFGQNPNADVLKITGNPNMVADGTMKLIKYMTKPQYAKVFPYYAKFNCDADQMFETCQKGGNQAPGRLLIRGSVKGVSYLMANKDSPVDGGRFMYRFYDDVTRSKDKGSLTMHERDISMYNNAWKKRKYDDSNSFEIFSGTTYSVQDFLSCIKRKYGGDTAIRTDINEYTRINNKTMAVFVSVPKLDKYDRCTFPAKFSAKEAILDRANNYEDFMAMDMQTPLPLKGNPFAYEKIKTYLVIPHGEDEGVTESCYACLDPPRTGKNYCSMGIFKRIGGLWYLTDCVFELRPMGELYNEIVEKIVNHTIVKLHIEKNTDTSLKRVLGDLLVRRGYTSCDISEIYTTENKNEKIADAEAAIRNNIVFPAFELYAQSSPMGEFMKWFTGYSYFAKNMFDDSADVVAMFAKKFVTDASALSKVRVLSRRRVG